MGIIYKSPAKLTRSLLRYLEYKKAKLEDIWDADILINNENHELIWNVSNCITFTLKKNVLILDAWLSEFGSLPLSVKLTKFQNMWKPDATEFTSPYCGNLAYFLATNSWPD